MLVRWPKGPSGMFYFIFYESMPGVLLAKQYNRAAL